MKQLDIRVDFENAEEAKQASDMFRELWEKTFQQFKSAVGGHFFLYPETAQNATVDQR